MKKTLLISIGALISIYSYAQSISNGTFEAYNINPNCSNPQTSYCINNGTNWRGLKTTYTSSCSYTDVIDCSSQVDYFNNFNGAFGTAGCQIGSARNGYGYAHCEFNGFYPSSTAKQEFLLQSLSGTFSTTHQYKITAYIDPRSGFTLTSSSNPYQISFCFVPQSAGTTASAILGNVRGQSYNTPTVTGTSGWRTIEFTWTPPTTTTYYLVLGSMLFCNDVNNTAYQFNVDDITIVQL